MFIITGLIDTENTFWCKWVELALQNEGNSYFEARKVVNQLKKFSNKDRVEYLSKLKAIKTRQLFKNDILKMQSENMFVGNHTHTHPMVDRCTSEELTNEMDYSRDCFNKWNISGYSIFAYPNGNFDDNSEIILKDNGNKMAFLFDHKVNKKEIDPMGISFSARLPCICTNIPVLKEVVGSDSGALFSSPGDFKALAQNILKLYNNLDLRNSLDRYSFKRFLNTFELDAINNEMFQMYKDVNQTES